MEPAIQASYDAQRDFSQKGFRSGCYAPFVSMYFTTLGQVLACCKNQAYALGDLSRQRLQEIWRGRKLADLRVGLKEYRFEGGCEFCGWQLAEGDYHGVFAANFERFPLHSEDPEWPQMIEFAGSNNCNFECVMCSGDLSSSIRAHREGLPPLPKVYTDQFFDDLRPFLPHLRQAKFLGGEPFLAQECFRIWDMMLEDGLKTLCHVTTNASQYNAKVERVLEALPVSVSVSVDGATRETVEKIRVNCDYDEFIRNLHRFRAYTKQRGTWMGISHCLMRANWHEFGDVLLLAESLECPVFVNTVLSPEHLSLYTLPVAKLNGIVRELESQTSRLVGKLRINRQVWEDQVRNLQSNALGRQATGLTQIQNTARNMGRTPDQNDSLDPWRAITEGWALAIAGRFQEALEQALSVQPSTPRYYNALLLCAYIREEMGDFDHAEADLDVAMHISRRPTEALTQRASLRLKQSRFEEGIHDALQASALCHEDDVRQVDIQQNLSYLYANTGRLEDARIALNRVLELKPDDLEIRLWRARALEEFGLREDAIREVEAALALNPKHTGIIEFSRQLQAGKTSPA